MKTIAPIVVAILNLLNQSILPLFFITERKRSMEQLEQNVMIVSGISTQDFIEKVAQRVAQIVSDKGGNNINESPDQFITIAQAADALHITVRTVQSHLRKGKIKFKRIGRRILIRKVDLDKALK